MSAELDFRQLFDEQLGFVWSALRRFGVCAADLPDQAQEVFITLHAIMGDYDRERPLRPWLFGVAYRIAMRYHTGRSRRRNASLPADIQDPRPAPDEQLARREARALVVRAIAKIGVGRRRVFVMSQVEGASIPEIAEALSIPVNTAYSRLRLARADFNGAVRRLRAAER